MQVNNIDSTNFKAFEASNARSALFKRLSTPKRYLKFDSFIRHQENKEYNIILNSEKFDLLSASVVDKNGSVVLTEKENILNKLFGLSPMRFLNKIAKRADKYVGQNLNKQ